MRKADKKNVPGTVIALSRVRNEIVTTKFAAQLAEAAALIADARTSAG